MRSSINPPNAAGALARLPGLAHGGDGCRVQRMWTFADAQFPQCPHSKAVADNAQRNHEEHESELSPLLVRNRFAATMLVMHSPRLERMPLRTLRGVPPTELGGADAAYRPIASDTGPHVSCGLSTRTLRRRDSGPQPPERMQGRSLHKTREMPATHDPRDSAHRSR